MKKKIFLLMRFVNNYFYKNKFLFYIKFDTITKSCNK